ncbi:5-formyltetrahydrofolate cyclo-ligase [Paraburkholderia sp. MMS20-SJTN17]|uniref:5-formyltetrahydrofolate cyclo-ligase n=1 Tax=Paraburkholderia translucens TaxID=2886945 RepID=A0ABS8KLB3_9BURK|nr:5-formyltetrahydrofolate cyclo-ligase [Paraburkholderia sp. MMS20-SJTN17]MCC8405555.1 5-formyltetrahydrofolate cyclo-ligase [Paraburkholderia sp. MMS20-SJTN17]
MDPSIACNPVPPAKKALRRTLLETRLQAASEPATNAALGRRVLDALKHYAVQSVGFYWPLAGEFDARGAIAIWLAANPHHEASLPIIKERGTPLEFHAWTPVTPMKIGHHKIAEPTSGRVVLPELLFVPCVGFDADGYRLGYGGGYYDRTLACWPAARKPITIGIAYEACRTGTLEREAHDIPLDLIVTEAGFHPALPG